MTFHCFFEQSGTFKNEFKKLGYDAYDYDILNDFGETDYVIDLFKEIEDAYTHTHNSIRQNPGWGSDHCVLSLCTIRESDQFMVQRASTWAREIHHCSEAGERYGIA